MKKTGLVLEGGAVRGIYTAGVLDVFMENDITFDGVIGVSAGAIHGCSFCSHQHGRSIRYYQNYIDNPRFMSFKSLIKTGNICETEFCYQEIPEKLDPYDYEALESNPVEFYVTCSNLETGKGEYIRIRTMRPDEIDFLRASASMPLVSHIVEKGGMKLLDGGISDSVPLKAFVRMGFKKDVVVLTRQAGYRKDPSSALPYELMYHKYPNFVKACRRRHINYNYTMDLIDRLESEGKIYVIRPSRNPGIGRLEKDHGKIQEVYELGRKDAEEKLAGLKEFLG